MSPWNHPIGSGAAYSTITGNWNLSTIDIYFNKDAWTIAAWKASSSDPLRTVTVTRVSVLQSNPGASDFCTNVGPAVYRIRIPDKAVASPPPWSDLQYQTDAHMSVADPDGQHVWELFGARKAANGLDWKATDLVKNDLTLKGAGFSCWHGTPSYGGSSMGGLIRAGELLNGINHALGITISGKQFNKNAPGGKSFVWPASSSDNPSFYSDVGNVYIGSLLAIPVSVNLGSLNFQTVQGRNMARALQLYGAYVYDGTGGSNKLIFRQDYAARAEVPVQTSGSRFIQDLQLIATLLKVVSNNGPNNIGGGGTPLAPPAPPLAQVRSSAGHSGDVLASSPRRTSGTSIPLAASAVALLPLDYLRRAQKREMLSRAPRWYHRHRRCE